jgi:transcriptional regulator with XRE-family HTH domain
VDDPERILQEIGRRIKGLRRQAGLSQRAFAEVLNSSVQWVSLLERGRQNLTVHTLVRVANKLKVPTAELLGPADPEPPPAKRGRGRPRKE